VLAFYYSEIQAGNTDPVLLRDYAVVESLIAGVDPQQVIGVIHKESRFNPKALNPNDKGCRSRGLVQIRECNHKVTDQEAFNPVFAVNFLIDNIDKCETWWKATCGKYVKLKNSQPELNLSQITLSSSSDR